MIAPPQTPKSPLRSATDGTDDLETSLPPTMTRLRGAAAAARAETGTLLREGALQDETRGAKMREKGVLLLREEKEALQRKDDKHENVKQNKNKNKNEKKPKPSRS